MIPSTKFIKNEPVRTLDDDEGVVSEVFISYPTISGLADWTAPQVHYLVTVDRNRADLYMEGELSDIRQMMLDLDLDPIDDNDADYWYSEVYEK
tara:strand:- start:862 stop:1143 length:282 start_codon:yes stop_codon:yes gene_type:complete